MPEQTNEVEIPKKVMLGFYSGLLALGLIIYIAWGLLYGSWNIFERTNLGMYAVTTMLCGFGITGILLYHLKEKSQ